MEILVYLEVKKIFFHAKKIDLPESYMFSQNFTKFGKSFFFEHKKKFVKKFFS